MEKKRGLYDTLVTLQWIRNTYPGTTVESIRGFIMDFHSRFNTRYFLLGGDNFVIPTQWEVYELQGEEYPTPSDYYYADYDDDWQCEVHVGRAPVQSTEEIENFCEKLLKYEKNPPKNNYPLEMLFFAFDLDNVTFGEVVKEDIYTLYIPYWLNVTKVYDSQDGNHREDVINELNAGKNLSNHIGHGDRENMGVGWFNHGWLLTIPDINALNNGDKQTVLYSISCECAHFPQEECIGEVFVKNTHGGGTAFMGFTSEAWYSPGNLEDYAFEFDRAFWKRLFLDNNYILGEAFSLSKNEVGHSNEFYQHMHDALVLLGDPALAIWTNTPEELTVNHPESAQPGEDIKITVKKPDNTPLENALVCLWKGNLLYTELYWKGLTNSDGEIIYHIPTDVSFGEMYITVTAQNFIPYEVHVI